MHIFFYQICDAPLKCINANEYGNIIATGNALGNVVLTEVSEILSTCEKNEKPLVTAVSILIKKKVIFIFQDINGIQ